MNDLAKNQFQLFENQEFGNIRVAEMSGEPWFVGKDVASVLGYSNPRKALADHVDDEDKNTVTIRDGIKGNPNMTIINESGLYSLILSSKLPNAKRFKRWVTAEVLPSIHRHGAYMTDETLKRCLADPDFLIQLATELKTEKEKSQRLECAVEVQKKQIGVLRPRAAYTDMVLRSKGLVTVSQIAKDYGLSAQELNQKLADLRVQYRRGKQWLLYARYQNKGYTHSATYCEQSASGQAESTMFTKWTQKGRLFIYARLKSAGILPLMERGNQE